MEKNVFNTENDRYLVIVFAFENVFNCVVLRFIIVWTGKSPETLNIQNGEYYDIISVRWELGSLTPFHFELDINNNNNKFKKRWPCKGLMCQKSD